MNKFEEIRAKAEGVWRGFTESPYPRITVGMGYCDIASGADRTLEAIKAEVARLKLDALVGITGCLGTCYAEPVVNIAKPRGPLISYARLNADKVPEFIEDVLLKNEPRPDLALGVWAKEPWQGIPSLFSLDFFKRQERRLMRNCGIIDPENIDHYIANDGYSALTKVLALMTPEAVLDELNRSGLTGRGGAFFPTGRKWDFLRTAPRSPKYIICNADEGDAGAFVNRTLLESDPHLILEGMLVGAFTMGSNKGYIYVRNEYPLVAKRLRLAIEQARERGLMGKNILGSGFDCDIEVVRGAGSYVCGEETALISSIQDSRGMPRIRPPFPAQSGLFYQPTNVNNVESYANVPLIILNGADWYASLGSEKLKGTKMFSLSGDIARPGVVEVPFGTPLRLVIEEMGGGVPEGYKLKAIQPGGPLGGILPAGKVDLPLDREPFMAEGVLLGSGGLVAIDERACMVDLAKLFSAFAEEESCARCVTCRIGSMRLVDILHRITEGRGKPEDLDTIRLLDNVMKNANCAHGQATPTAATCTIRFFADEYEAHIREKRCPAGVCESLA